MPTNIGTGPQDIPLNQFLGEMAYRDANPRVVMVAQKNTGMTLNTSATAVQFPNTVVDTHIGLSNTNSRYTVPYSGDYLVMFHLNVLSNSNVTNIGIRIDGTLYSNYQISDTNHPRKYFTMTSIVPNLQAGQYIEIRAYVNTGTVTMDNAGNWMVYKM